MTLDARTIYLDPEKDADIIEYLDAMKWGGQGAYIRKLIRRDMHKRETDAKYDAKRRGEK